MCLAERIRGLKREHNTLCLDQAQASALLTAKEKEYVRLTELVDKKDNEHNLYTQVKTFLSTLSVESKRQVKESIEKMVSYVLCYVYGEGHRFILDIVHRRNQNEVDFFIDDGNVMVQLKKPFAGKGGGKVSVAAMALQIAVLEYAGLPRALFLDEATKYADTNAVERVAQFLKEYSEKRQVINITHHTSMADASDAKVYVSKNADGIAEVTNAVQ